MLVKEAFCQTPALYSNDKNHHKSLEKLSEREEKEGNVHSSPQKLLHIAEMDVWHFTWQRRREQDMKARVDDGNAQFLRTV